VSNVVAFWEMQPHLELLGKRDKDEAYLSAQPGKQYVLYFTEGGSVDLNLKAHPGKFQLRWIDIRTGNWGKRTTLTGGKAVPITAPNADPWVAVLVSR